MKQRFSRYSIGFKVVVLIWGILISLLFLTLFWAVKTTNRSAELMSFSEAPEEKTQSIPNKMELTQLLKEINWLEQQLVLAKSDSLSLGINLRDSILSIQLKGNTILKTKILAQKPELFLHDIASANYYRLFGKPSVIKSETASIPKKPIKKVTAKIGIGIQDETQLPSISDKRFHWTFYLDNNFTLVINGVIISKDSVSNMFYKKDILKYNFGKMLQDPIKGTHDLTLFLWVSDNDARAIYRALPEKAKALILN